MKIEEMVHDIPRWLEGTGPHSELIMSCRIRLARNLANYPFTNRSNFEEDRQVIATLRDVAPDLRSLSQSDFFEIDQMEPLDKQILAERHLISPPFMKKRHPRGVWVGSGENLSVMVNEEDHLRMQCISSGLAVWDVWKTIHQFDESLSGKLKYAFSSSMGFLTACPTNVGTGLRISFAIHLPALVITQQVESTFKQYPLKGITVRGFYGEGTDVMGNIFQVSNQVTLGKTEEELLELVEAEANRLIEREMKAREQILTEARILIEDKVHRAQGIFHSARLISSAEFMSLLSVYRLGIDLGIIRDVNRSQLNRLMILAQPGHIQKMADKELEPRERDQIRAEMVRKKLWIRK